MLFVDHYESGFTDLQPQVSQDFLGAGKSLDVLWYAGNHKFGHVFHILACVSSISSECRLLAANIVISISKNSCKFEALSIEHVAYSCHQAANAYQLEPGVAIVSLSVYELYVP